MNNIQKCIHTKRGIEFKIVDLSLPTLVSVLYHRSYCNIGNPIHMASQMDNRSQHFGLCQKNSSLNKFFEGIIRYIIKFLTNIKVELNSVNVNTLCLIEQDEDDDQKRHSYFKPFEVFNFNSKLLLIK